MIIPSFNAKGGIASVVSGYRNSIFEEMHDIRYIETYLDKSRLRKFFKAIASYFIFIYQLIFWHPDIIHIHSSFGSSFYRKMPFIIIASWLQKPIVNHIHGSAIDELYYKASNRKKRLVIKTFSKCNRLIVLSEELKKEFSMFTNDENIIIIENYCILNEKNYIEKKNPQKQILFLGFLSQAKGCFDIPLILKKVKTVIPNVKLVMAGVGNEYDEAHIKKLVDENGLTDNVVFPGWVKGSDKEYFLKNSDIFLLPSYGEAMPMSILESMGYGLPIISTNVGGIPQLVKSNLNGFLCEPGNIDYFSEKIIELLSNQELVNCMGKKSMEIVKNRFLLEHHIENIFSVYESLFENREVI